MPLQRKKAFSSKQKKAQLQEKRARKRDKDWGWGWGSDKEETPENGPSNVEEKTKLAMRSASKIKREPKGKKPTQDGNRLESQFDKLTRDEIEANKKKSMLPLERLDPSDGLTMSFDNTYSADVDIPVRPRWWYGESRDEIERREQVCFASWLEKIQELKDDKSVSIYEKNLEVWRQLWRVVEISDILLLVVDIRHPVLHFPPSLYRYITETMKKPMVVVLNKTDLVAKSTVELWENYFRQQFPLLTVTSFCCYKNNEELLNDTNLCDMKLKRKKSRKRVYDDSRTAGLLEACRAMCPPEKRDIVDWKSIIELYKKDTQEDESDSEEETEAKSDGSESGSSDGEGSEHDEDSGDNDTSKDQQSLSAAHQNYVTLGLVGHPNTGKSTVINSIIGKTVVSTSRTPGHTKHFQTIHINSTLRLCDCPGLVFPCLVDRPLQVLAGLYNIAQVQEPFTSVEYLARRVPIEKILDLKLPETAPHGKWSAWAICEAFAIDLGFYTSRTAWPDVYRADNVEVTE